MVVHLYFKVFTKVVSFEINMSIAFKVSDILYLINYILPLINTLEHHHQINAHPIRRMRSLFEDNKKKLASTQ